MLVGGTNYFLLVTYWKKQYNYVDCLFILENLLAIKSFWNFKLIKNKYTQ